MKRFNEKYVKIIATGCWEWAAGKNAAGYGRVGKFRGTSFAHRVSYMLFHNLNKLNPRDKVMHTCDNPSCVNPAHLVLGTQLDNIKDRDKKNRQAQGTANDSKLTDSDVRDIRRRLAAGEYQKDIAKDYPVTRSVIGHINIGLAWRHVI